MEEVNNKKHNAQNDLLCELKEFYKNILVELKDLLDSYGYSTPLEVFGLFYYLSCFWQEEEEAFKRLYLYTGVNYSFALEQQDTMGIQVLLYGGLCRHKSAMLCDIYRMMNLDSVMLLGYSETLLNIQYNNSQNKQIADRNYVANMLKKISEGASLDDFRSQLKKRKISYSVRDVHDSYFLSNPKLPNHAIVMVGDKERYYLDPMNNVSFYKEDEDVITLRNKLGQYFFFVLKTHRFLYPFELEDFEKTYMKILELPIANEKENSKQLREIYAYLNSNTKGIKEFLSSHDESITYFKQKSLSLRTM